MQNHVNDKKDFSSKVRLLRATKNENDKHIHCSNLKHVIKNDVS